jgi:hypothetical protein
MSEFSNCIIAMLRASPNGLTAKEIADHLGTTAGNISSRLSKLAAYGIIGKARSAIVRHGSRGTVYQAPSDDPGQPRTILRAGPPAPWSRAAPSPERERRCAGRRSTGGTATHCWVFRR